MENKHSNSSKGKDRVSFIHTMNNFGTQITDMIHENYFMKDIYQQLINGLN